MNIFRKVLGNPNAKLKKRYELADVWNIHEHHDQIQDGVTFTLKYLGSTLVEELDEDGGSYGDKISAVAVKAVVNMAKVSKKKLVKVKVTISPRGILVVNIEDQSIITNLDIHRISFCTADREHGRVFAFIARNEDNETMECRAFLCKKRKMAQGVTLAVAESFRLAKELNDIKVERTRMMRQPENSKMARLLDNLSTIESCDISIGRSKVIGSTGIITSTAVDKTFGNNHRLVKDEVPMSQPLWEENLIAL